MYDYMDEDLSEAIDEGIDADMDGDDVIDAFLKMFKATVPPIAYYSVNHKRYNEAKKATQTIADIVWETDEDAEIDVKPDPLTGTSIQMEIRTNLFITDNMDKFCKALKKADTMDITPLTDGRILIGLTFEEAFNIISPDDIKEQSSAS